MVAHDKIRLTGMEFYAYHGVSAEETALGQRFILDVVLYCNLQKAGNTDNVADTVNYAEVYQCVRECVTKNKYYLLERLAEITAQRILATFSCKAVKVTVHKPQAPIPGIWRDISVEIFRKGVRERGSKT